jgi:hypothetical protein
LISFYSAFRELVKCAYKCLGLVIPDVDVAVVKGGEHPWLGGMKVTGLDAIGPGRQTALDVQAKRLKD